MTTQIHLVWNKTGWAVKQNNTVLSEHTLKTDALVAARKIGKAQQAELVIHKRDGHIQTTESYGKDSKYWKG